MLTKQAICNLTFCWHMAPSVELLLWLLLWLLWLLLVLHWLLVGMRAVLTFATTSTNESVTSCYQIPWAYIMWIVLILENVQTIKIIFSLSPHLLPLTRKWNNVAGVAVHGNWDVHCAHHLSFRLCFYCHLAALWENDHCFLHFFRGRQLHWCYIATWSHHLGHGQGYRDGRRQWKWRRRHYCCGW